MHLVEIETKLRKDGMLQIPAKELEATGLHEGEEKWNQAQKPAVVRGRESGHIALGFVTIDLQSSGEHFGTFFLMPRGVLDQNDFSMPEENRSYIGKNFNSYDYWYTPQVEGDIHTDLKNAPEKVRELLNSCTLEQMELPKDGMNL